MNPNTIQTLPETAASAAAAAASSSTTPAAAGLNPATVLPADVMTQALALLNPQQIGQTRHVCRQWRDLGEKALILQQHVRFVQMLRSLIAQMDPDKHKIQRGTLTTLLNELKPVSTFNTIPDIDAFLKGYKPQIMRVLTTLSPAELNCLELNGSLPKGYKAILDEAAPPLKGVAWILPHGTGMMNSDIASKVLLEANKTMAVGERLLFLRMEGEDGWYSEGSDRFPAIVPIHHLEGLQTGTVFKMRCHDGRRIDLTFARADASETLQQSKEAQIDYGWGLCDTRLTNLYIDAKTKQV